MAKDRASLVNAQAQLARYKELFAQNIIARQDLDTQQSLAGQYEGVVKNDQALIDSARLSLIYCRITSPIDGRVGRPIDPGNIVRAFDTQGLMVITQIQPVAVNFNIPEHDEPRPPPSEPERFQTQTSPRSRPERTAQSHRDRRKTR